jgi:hypothetical protein
MIFVQLHPAAMLALLQSTQLNLFERFLTQARTGIDSTGITAGMQNVAYVVLLVGFLWQVYQSALHGGDVRGLGTSLIKYVVTAVVVMNYGAVFTTINQGFVSAGNWVSNSAGGNVLGNWGNDLRTQFTVNGEQHLWGLITGSIAGLIDGVLIIVAYLLYPIVVVIFGFFYIFYGSILYIFGPIIVALMPIVGVNRLAKSYVENIFIWNAWPILYGGFGALLTAVQMGQLGQMLSQNNFLGGLGNLEGSFLIGFVSVVYSLAIAFIPFVAKRIVSGDVGSTAAAMVGAAVTALTAGAAGIEGAAAGVAAARAGSAGAASSGASSGTALAGSAKALPASTGGNLPAPPQRAPIAASSATNGFESSSSAPTLEGHAEMIRNSISDAMGAESAGATEVESASAATESVNPAASGSSGAATKTSSGSRPSGAQRRGPTVHRYNVGTWGAYHAARIAASTIVKAAQHGPSDNSEGS